MSEDHKEYALRAVSIFKCDRCHGIHLRGGLNDKTSVVGIMDPDVWAEMFMADEDFRREVKLLLERPA